MRYRPLGNSGLLVTVTGLGCNNSGRRLDLARTRAVVDAAIDAGITLFDTADVYGNGGASEELPGQVLAGRRDQVVLATKFGPPGGDLGYGPAAGAKGSRAYLKRTVEQAAQPGCASVIAGATSPEQVKANAAAGERQPSAADLADLDRLASPQAAASASGQPSLDAVW